MKDIKTYLESEKQSYSKGIELLKKYGGNSKEIAFLNTDEPQAMHKNMLVKRLNNMFRIGTLNESVKEEPKVQKPITIKKVHFSKTPNVLDKSNELTNKLLARNWDQLDEKEHAYFNGNAAVFEFKKELFFRNSKIESELKSHHAALPHAESDEQRQEISGHLVTLKKEQNDNWAKIDDSDLVVVPDNGNQKISEAELLKKRNNLRAYISKLEKQLKEEPGHKNLEKRKESLEKAKLELNEVEKNLSV